MYAVIEGGHPPRGTVEVSGAKNSATRLLAASLLADGPVELERFPVNLVDVGHKVAFAEQLGATVRRESASEHLIVDASGMSQGLSGQLDFTLPIRTTYLLAAAQLVRGQSAMVPYPGGCSIGGGPRGGRGYDLHVMVWERLGCFVKEEAQFLRVEAPEGLRGGEIDFPISTVGGTENAILCASVARGKTEVRNAYITPEVTDLIDLLRLMGAHIEVYGTSRLVIEGVEGTLGTARKTVMSDRIEALTWIVYALIARGSVSVHNVPFEAMDIPLSHLRHAGIDLLTNDTSVHVTPESLLAGSVQPFEVACGTYPGVISDMQPFFVLLGLAADGTSRIYDYRYPERIAFVQELQKLVHPGAVRAEHGSITTYGPAAFTAGRARSTDLRGSMAAVIAALCAPGTSRIDSVEMALRGYNSLELKLRALGISLSLSDDSD